MERRGRASRPLCYLGSTSLPLLRFRLRTILGLMTPGLHPRSSRPDAKAAAKRPRLKTKRSRRLVPSTIRILIADDLPMDRLGLIALLRTQSDFVIVGEAASTSDAAALCKRLQPNIVLLALRLDPGGSKSAIGPLRARCPNVPVLAVAERGEGQCLVLNPPGSRRGDASPPGACSSGTDCLQLAVAEGATGTIRRSATPEELFRAVRLVASGAAWYESGTATAIMRHALTNGAAGDPKISQRELEVAELIAAGRSNKEISSALAITEPTVKKHVGHLLLKLKLQDRLQIGLYVARNPLFLRPLGSRRD